MSDEPVTPSTAINKVQLHHGFGVNWSAKGIGFGQLYFYTDNGLIYCDNELMDKEFIKQVLCQMVDDCVLTCPRGE
jgi:hypothetical protein